MIKANQLMVLGKPLETCKIIFEAAQMFNFYLPIKPTLEDVEKANQSLKETMKTYSLGFFFFFFFSSSIFFTK